MIDPFNVINYERTDDELLEFFLFSIFVAGKNAETTYKVLDRFLEGDNTKIYERLRAWQDDDTLVLRLRKSRTGKYRLLKAAIEWLATCPEDDLIFWLRHCSTDQLEECPGVGPKTSRFFVLYTRKDAEVAVLDTHILKFLRDHGIDAPKSTPPAGKRYALLEQEYLKLAKLLAPLEGKTLPEFDLALWNEYRSAPFDPLKAGVPDITLNP